MPRQPKPWFRDARGWYIQFQGQQVFLGEHPPKSPHPQRDKSGDWHPPQSILDAFYEQMAGKPVKSSPISVPVDGVCVLTVLDAYLEWLLNRVHEGSNPAQRTGGWDHRHLHAVCRAILGPDHAGCLLRRFRLAAAPRTPASMCRASHAVPPQRIGIRVS